MDEAQDLQAEPSPAAAGGLPTHANAPAANQIAPQGQLAADIPTSYFSVVPPAPPPPSMHDPTGAQWRKAHKTWFLTLHAATTAEDETLAALSLTYLIRSRTELCPTTSRPHRHYLMTFKAAKRFAAVKKLLPRGNWQIPINRDAAIDYCAKLDSVEDPDEEIYILDNRKQGTRSDLETFTSALHAGTTDRQLSIDQPVTYLRYSSHASRFRIALRTPRTRWTLCLWLHGEAGTGKSRWAALAHPASDWITYDGRFFGGIGISKTAVMDDPDLSNLSPFVFKQMCNRTRYKARVLGAHSDWPYELLIVIHNDHPDKWNAYQYDAAVRSRVDFPERGQITEWTTRDIVPDVPVWAQGDAPPPGSPLPDLGVDERL